MKARRKTITIRKHSELRLPKDKAKFFSEDHDLYPPSLPERNKSQKEYSFVVDWQMSGVF